MPASASLSIAAVADQVGGLDLPDPVTLAPDLQAALAGMVDPRQRRGIRHGLVAVLTAAVCAVTAGARSFVAVAEWVADLPTDLAAVLGMDRRCPSESAIRRLIGKVDADRFDIVICAFVQTLTAAVAPAGRRRVLAVDGKTLRGSRRTDTDGVTRPGRHLLAVIDHDARAVLGQVDVDGKTSEITAFAPLLDTLTSTDLTGVVITVDALHTQREHVEQLHRRGAHWVLSVKGNQPRLRRQLATLPVARGRGVAPQRRDRARTSGDPHPQGRHRRRRDRVPARGPGHPGHPPHPLDLRPHRARGRWRTETVYASPISHTPGPT